jgi:DNA-binding GntR family transcriptional regulator
MARKKSLTLKTLREQVYDYVREALNRGDLVPGESINLTEISEKLGVSKTPLRFALLQLENEGFVTIIPRRGCVVNVLSLVDIRNIYQVIGALEASVIISEFHKFNPNLIEHMRRFNEMARNGLDEDDFDKYYEYNLKFHNVYLNRTSNAQLVRIAHTLKNRLYDFPRKKRFVKEWEVNSTGEHDQLIELMAKGDAKAAADFVRDVHWSYHVQEKYIKQYYLEALENVRAAR